MQLKNGSWLFLLLLGVASTGLAQTPPDIGYLFPPGGAPGATVDVKIGGYNWTPDMQLFVHDPRVKLEITGPPSGVIVPEPPYWFGKKARDNDFPLPREFPGRLTIAPDTPPGLIRWQAANANGATASGVLLVSRGREQFDSLSTSAPIAVESIPVAVVGQIHKLEEVDRISFTATRAGPISLDLWTRRLGSQMNAIVEVRDANGQLVADGADTAGHDLQLTFSAKASARYTISLYDTDFRGHHSFVYRLVIHDGPRIVATIPAAGKRGETRPVEFVGIGIASGEPKLESVTRDVTFPADANVEAFQYELATPFGNAACGMQLSNLPEVVEPNAAAPQIQPLVPTAITGILDIARGEDRFPFTATKGALWSINCRSAKTGIPLDPAIAVLDSTGKELTRVDDLPGTTDSGLVFTVPADGNYQIAVADQSGQAGSRAAVYRLAIEPQQPDFSLTAPDKLALQLGGKANLVVKGSRLGGFAQPITLEIAGLPAGVTIPTPLTIPADKSELTVEFTCAADVAATAAIINVRGTAQSGEQVIARQPTPTLLALTMKPRVKLTPEGLDDVRKWPRGSTYLAPVLIERLEGFAGEVVLEQTANQQRVRQGITGPDFVAPADATRVEYPVFLPEWLETTKTSRIILNGVAKTPDPKGNVRHLLNKMELRIGMLPVGAILKVAPDAEDLQVHGNEPFEIPIHLTRSSELSEPASVELVVPVELSKRLSAAPLVVTATDSKIALKVAPGREGFPTAETPLTIRATVLRGGKWPVVTETTCRAEFLPAAAQ